MNGLSETTACRASSMASQEARSTHLQPRGTVVTTGIGAHLQLPCPHDKHTYTHPCRCVACDWGPQCPPA